MPDTPTPTREEVVAFLAAVAAGMNLSRAAEWGEAEEALTARGIADPVGACARAALAALAPDPWAEADAKFFSGCAEQVSAWGDAEHYAARYRRAIQRARGVPVTEDGR